MMGKQEDRDKEIDWLEHSKQDSGIPHHAFRLANAGHGSPNSWLLVNRSGGGSGNDIGSGHTAILKLCHWHMHGNVSLAYFIFRNCITSMEKMKSPLYLVTRFSIPGGFIQKINYKYCT